MKTFKPEEYLSRVIETALQAAFELEDGGEITIERPRQENFGDYATTVALSLARTLRRAPRQIAETLVQHLRDEEGLVEKTTIDGPGFINFTLRPAFWQRFLLGILSAGEDFGRADWGGGEKVQVEFVSANPTGPLNVVSARAAAIGDVLVSLFNHVGFDASREYYINDAGRQVRLLGASVAARYLQLLGKEAKVPEDGYQGDYIRDLAQEILDEHGEKFAGLPESERNARLAELALDKMIRLHKETMQRYRVEYQVWFHESDLRRERKHEKVLQRLGDNGYIYEKDGAVWFRTTDFGDEKDRVLVTREGEPTYFLVDIAYHEDKYARGFRKIYDLWGPDHHGYIARMQAAIQALGHPKDSFEVRIIQQVNMLRGGEVVKMSKRRGNIIEMNEVLEEVGIDAARYFFIMRRLDQPLDFDIDLAKKQTEENPVYYVQYAHARVANILAYAREQGVDVSAPPQVDLLAAPEELTLIKKLAEFPEVVSKAAKFLEPHRLTNYLTELAGTFHSFYHKHRVVTEDAALTRARLALVRGTQQVLKNALGLLKIEAPERM